MGTTRYACAPNKGDVYNSLMPASQVDTRYVDTRDIQETYLTIDAGNATGGSSAGVKVEIYRGSGPQRGEDLSTADYDSAVAQTISTSTITAGSFIRKTGTVLAPGRWKLVITNQSGTVASQVYISRDNITYV